MRKTAPYLVPAALALLNSRVVRAEDHYYTHAGAGAIIQNEITVHSSVNSTYFSLLGNSFGYGGIQQGSASNARNWIFSFWDQNKEKTLLLGYAPDLMPQRIGRFGDNVDLEGTGFQLLFTYPWKEETKLRGAYRSSIDADKTHLLISGFYFDGDHPIWRYSGTFRMLTSGKPPSGFYGFVENFGGVAGKRDASFANSWLYTADGKWEEALRVTVAPQNEAIISAEAGGLRVVWGTPTQKDGDAVTWSTAPGNAPIPIPFRVDAGRQTVVTIDNDKEGLAHLVDDIGGFEVDGYYDTGDQILVKDAIVTTGVAGAAPESVYRSSREGQQFAYELVGLTPSVEHLLRLHFAETSQDAAGKRKMDIDVNGSTVLSGFDVFQEAGGKLKALVRDIPVRTDDKGKLVIRFAASSGSAAPATVSGIETFEGKSGPDGGVLDAGGIPPDASVRDAGRDVSSDASGGGRGGAGGAGGAAGKAGNGGVGGGPAGSGGGGAVGGSGGVAGAGTGGQGGVGGQGTSDAAPPDGGRIDAGSSGNDGGPGGNGTAGADGGSPPGDSGCGCHTGSNRTSTMAAWLVIGLAWWGARARRRTARTAPVR